MSYQPPMSQPIAQGLPLLGQPVQGQPMMQPLSGGSLDPLSKFDGHDRIGIFQKVEGHEVITWFEPSNNYFLCGEDGTKLFYVKEESNPCTRTMCCGKRSFKMALIPFIGDDWKSPENACLTMEKGFECSFFCLNRPNILVKKCTPEDAESTDPIASVHSPFHFCEMDYEVRDSEGNALYHICGSRSQAGAWCKCPCSPCNKLEFEIRDATKSECLGMVSKSWTGCGKDAISGTDTFVIDFPKRATNEHKAYIVAGVFLLSFIHFNQSSLDRMGHN
eukprot:TRINITY_DN2922_c0_g3_i1.p1 TRINITY_DN2922_c0_g3~~TRINITY_DN2922_c0_g3_i1.p1  ORF type:complete len:276 (+),score=62.42 TRINITY_DN2922_c0_g3_i1:200-1027(+)